MSTTASQYFTAAQRASIDEAVSLAEKSTSGEIVPVLATRADTYDQAHYQAAILAAILGVIVTLGIFCLPFDELAYHPWEVPASLLLPVLAAGLALGYQASRRFPAVQRALIPQEVLDRRVYEGARRAFRDLGLRETRGATAIMIHVSLFERVVVVLADKAIAAHHPDATWDGVRDRLLSGLASGRGDEGFTQAIAECGRILAERFPIPADDTNELPNALRVLD
jgi:putative membrane protein